MSEKILLHGLIQKALRDATELHTRLRTGKDGQVWQMGFTGWKRTGHLDDPQDWEDFLVGKLTQEERRGEGLGLLRSRRPHPGAVRRLPRPPGHGVGAETGDHLVQFHDFRP